MENSVITYRQAAIVVKNNNNLPWKERLKRTLFKLFKITVIPKDGYYPYYTFSEPIRDGHKRMFIIKCTKYIKHFYWEDESSWRTDFNIYRMDDDAFWRTEDGEMFPYWDEADRIFQKWKFKQQLNSSYRHHDDDDKI